VTAAVRPWVQWVGAAVLAVATAVACAAAPRDQSGGSTPPASTEQQDIKHLVPAPDSVGPGPTRFEWTAIEGAESYWLRIWTEVDVRLLSEDGLKATSLDLPPDAEFAPGTYFWSVVARRGDQAVAESGLAAFVVMQ